VGTAGWRQRVGVRIANARFSIFSLIGWQIRLCMHRLMDDSTLEAPWVVSILSAEDELADDFYRLAILFCGGGLRNSSNGECLRPGERPCSRRISTLTYLQERKQAMYDAGYMANFSRHWTARGRESCLEKPSTLMPDVPW
jgi:hypothetical protein